MPKPASKIEALAAVAYMADTGLDEYDYGSKATKNHYRKIVRAIIRKLTSEDLAAKKKRGR